MVPLSVCFLLLSVVFYWLGQALCAWKWQRLVLARGTRVSLFDCCRFYAAGMFGNLWLPTNVGGDALRTTLLARTAPELGLSGAAASVLVERLTGFAALLALVAGGLTWRSLTPDAGDRAHDLTGLPPTYLSMVTSTSSRHNSATIKPADLLRRLHQHHLAITRRQQNPSTYLSTVTSTSSSHNHYLRHSRYTIRADT